MIKNKIVVLSALCGILIVGGAVTTNRNVYIASASGKEAIATTNYEGEDLKIDAKSAYLTDFSTKTVIYAKSETKRLPIASMCKIMTLLLSFEAIDDGALSMDEEIMISEKAASMGGSQVFLEANAKYSVRELIKSIVVCSANDSCVAIAERVCGSEKLFVERMNKRAKELGMYDTLFANCTGLPKQPQYSCAKDVAIMLKELLNHEEYYTFGKVWMDKFQHPKGRYTEISNTNKLVRFYNGCDGGKTGFTNEAGFCLAATAIRNDTRVISVAIGADDSQKRFDGVREMFDYAFANYVNKPIYRKDVPLETPANVDGGKNKQIPVAPVRDIRAFTKRGEKVEANCKISLKRIKAPVQKGEQVGEIVVYSKGVEIDRVPLVTLETVEKATIWDKIQDVARSWNG